MPKQPDPDAPVDVAAIVPAAIAAECHPGTVDRLVRSGRLPVQWHAGHRLVSVARLREILSERPRRAAAHEGLRP
jgi:hypothetical protein